jgi:hypothetical protein
MSAALYEACPSVFFATISHGRNAPAPRSKRDRPSRAAIRLRGVALSAVKPCTTDFAVSRCAREQLLGLQCLGIVRQQGKPAQTGLQPLGDGDLANCTAQDDLAGGVEPPIGQGVDHVVPSAGLDLSSFGGAGRPLPRSIGTIERSASERRGMMWAEPTTCPKARKLVAQRVGMTDDLK